MLNILRFPQLIIDPGACVYYFLTVLCWDEEAGNFLPLYKHSHANR